MPEIKIVTAGLQDPAQVLGLLKDKMNYLDMLIGSHKKEIELDGEMSRLEFLSVHVFGFVTYDTQMDELFARKAVDFCQSINGKSTFDLIRDKDRYRWFLVMANMPFFMSKITWGCSIRGAFWNNKVKTLKSCGIWDGETQLCDGIVFDDSQWHEFISAVCEFACV